MAIITAPSPAARSERRPRLAVAGLLLLTVAVRIPALVADRHLTFDDGVFGASAVAMRHGGVPFRDVFSSQGPLFLPLVWAADLVGARSLDAPRLVGLLAGVLLVAAVLVCARQLGGRSAALVVSGVVAVTGSVLWVTAPVAADGPALALATSAVAGALLLRRRPALGLALATGAVLGAALAVKSLVLPAAVPVGLVLLGHARRGRPRLLAGAVAAALVIGLASSVPWGLDRVWDQSVDYHLDAAGERTPGANAAKVLSTLGDRDLPLVALAGVSLAWAGWRRPSRRGRAEAAPCAGLPRWAGDGGVLVAAWLAGVVAVLLLEHPLWRPHVAHLAPPIALLAARHLPPLRLVAAALALTLPWHVAHNDGVLWPSGYDGPEAAAVASLAALPDGALAISDEPGLVWRAGRRTPPDLVDTSILRIESERLTATSVAAAAASPPVCAVLVWSERHFGSFQELPRLLADARYEVAARYGDRRVLYVDRGCAGA